MTGDDDAHGPGTPDPTEPAPADLTPEQEAAVRAVLAALPDPELPADVADRIAAALARPPASAAATVLPELGGAGAGGTGVGADAGHGSGGPVSWWRSPRLLQAVAGVVVVGLVGLTAITLLDDGGDAGGPPDDAVVALSQQTLGPITTTGWTYSVENLDRRVRRLAAAAAGTGPGIPSAGDENQSLSMGDTAATAPDTAVEAAPDSDPYLASDNLASDEASGSTTQSTRPRAEYQVAVDSLTGLVNDPAQRRTCVDQLAGTPGVEPLAVDIGRWQGRAAAVFVLPNESDAAYLDAWVVGSTCSTADDPFPYSYQRVLRP